MSETKPDKEFWDLADAFIALASQRCDSVRSGKVSAAQLYAAARFNIFVVASLARNKEEFSAKREEHLAYFVTQYEKMLRENLGDYEANFEKYLGRKKA
jgi:hypothetical protein